MIVFNHRRNQALRAARQRLETAASLFQVPSVVFAAAACRRLKVHLFVLYMACIWNVKITGQLVKSKAPGIAQTQRPNFAAMAVNVRKRIAGRNAVRSVVRLHIDTQDLAQQRARVLRTILNIFERWVAAVTAANVKESIVGAKYNAAAIVDLVRLRKEEHDLLAVRVGTVRIDRRCEPADHGIPRFIRVAHIEILFGRVGRRKSDIE